MFNQCISNESLTNIHVICKLNPQALTLVVGYFVLGPSELYKLVKEIGKFVQNFRTLGAEATKSFESTMENQLELTELRKAQRELNDAFSFRRSINTDEGMTAFDENLYKGAEEVGVAAGAAAAVATEMEDGTATKKKKRLVRRKKKAVVEETPLAEERDLLTEYPDLDMLDEPSNGATASTDDSLRAQRMERLGGDSSTTGTQEPDWFTASEEDIASKVLSQQPNNSDPALEAYEKNRFQSQLSAEAWNKQIMDNEDDLAPLAMVMKRLAILEEEKQAADRRLEEEYQRRMDNEDKYYLEKRRILEESIEEIQTGLYGGENKAEGPKFT